MPRRLYLALVAALSVTVIVAGAAVFVLTRRHDAAGLPQVRVSGLPAAVTTGEANLMALSPVPNRPAPDFTLRDQYGRVISLASLRGRPVVLNFMDPHCVDICPLVAQELRDAEDDLTGAARDTVFLAVNVNPYALSTADVLAFSRTHLLTTIPTWHFLTGPETSLSRVWRAYGIEVHAPSPTADVIHTSATYFISPRGTERYLASPAVDHTAQGVAFLPADTLRAWGRGIAAVAASLSGS